MVEIFKEKYGCVPYLKETCGVFLDANIHGEIQYCLSRLIFTLLE